MRKSDVEVGGIYAAKVSGKIARVKILKAVSRWTSRPGHWDTERTEWEALSLETGRKIRIRSAQRLRRRMAEA